MKKIIRFVALMLVFCALPISVIGCNVKEEATASESETEKESKDMTTEKPTETISNICIINGESVTLEPMTIDLSKDHGKVKRLGRTVLTDRGIACDHSASGIEFKGYMVGDVTVKICSQTIKSNSPSSYYTIYVDGKRQPKRISVSGTDDTVVATIRNAGEHTVRIVKQTEANYTISEMRSISITGYLTEAPAEKDYYIEFIGDSLTCGMGNMGTSSSSEPQSARWEDASRSYGYMAAEELGADYSIVSQSGIGISYGWSRYSISPFYEKAGYTRDKETDFDFASARVPDLLVINMGTNDYYINKNMDDGGKHCSLEEVIADTQALIEMVRGKYGKDIPIIWPSRFVYLGDEYVAAIEQGIKNYAVEKTGDADATMEDVGIYRIDFTKSTGGAQGHPTVDGHTKAKNELVAFIEEKQLLK